MAPLVFGSLVYNYQATDVYGPFDLLFNASKEINGLIDQTYAPVNPEVLSRAADFTFVHVGINKEPVTLLTTGIQVIPTHTVEDCPELDYLLIGGPNPVDFELHPKFAELIRKFVASGKTVFSTCTGSSVLAQAGVLDGKSATINNIEYNWIKKQFPKVNWRKDTKWVVDGNIWTGSGAVAGMDMFAHWIKEKFGRAVLTQGALGLDYEPRDVNGLFTVLPPRYDDSGKQISTHVFPK